MLLPVLTGRAPGRVVPVVPGRAGVERGAEGDDGLVEVGDAAGRGFGAGLESVGLVFVGSDFSFSCSVVEFNSSAISSSLPQAFTHLKTRATAFVPW